MSLKTILRLSLFQFGLGALSLLNYGLLNRVMAVELGIPLAATSFIVSAHYFAAPISLPIGHLSDSRSYFGYRRTPYVIAGVALTAVLTALAPFLALGIARQGTSLVMTLLGTAYFLVMGGGIYVAATAYISLVTDLSTEEERGKVVSIIWTMMMLGILIGAGLTAATMERYDESRFITIFIGMGTALALLTAATLWRMEKRAGEQAEERAQSQKARGRLRQAMQLIMANVQARRFFAFLSMAIFFFFIQEVVLEPFGGQVFGLKVRETTLFNAYQMVGVLIGMFLSGKFLVKKLGKRRTTAMGTVMGAIAFFFLVLSAVWRSEALLRPSILGLGLALGFFNVGGLSLMMDMSTTERTGLFMGAWSLAQALARGFSGVFGGAVRDVALALGASLSLSFATVFAVEAVGLLAILKIFQGISVRQFRRQAIELEQVLRALD
jgi:BCD family chlorophyll transporter-like MFS transporter